MASAAAVQCCVLLAVVLLSAIATAEGEALIFTLGPEGACNLCVQSCARIDAISDFRGTAEFAPAQTAECAEYPCRRKLPCPHFKARMFHEGCQATSVSTGMQEPILRRHQPRDGNVNVASAAPAWK